ncbi:MAG TPA: NAD(P)-dependent alcohol dehydrogenase [Nocardioidaceae bacterium]|nr:NAD(P)-dependent alcohol dehydrogenase [Nocardioidaceae bacterium]
MRTTAAVLRGADQPFALEPIDLADPGPGEVLVRIVGAGMCHTDLLPRAGMSAPPPIVVGHEGSGIVEALGPGVSGVSAGDHVILSFDACRTCRNCRSAQPSYCDTFVPRNMAGVALDGTASARDAAGGRVANRWFAQSSFAGHALVPEANLVRVDPSLALEVLGPLACGVLTGAGAMLKSLPVRPGSAVAVFGAGGVGLSAVMAARVAGATTIVAVDLNDKRLQLAEELGATHVVRGGADDVVRQIRKLTAGGADCTLDTTGVPAVISGAVDALRITGTCGLVGAQRGDLVLGPAQIAFGKTITGIIEGGAVPSLLIPELLALWQQGRFPFDRLIQTFPLAEINEAERAMHRGDVVKPVLLP